MKAQGLSLNTIIIAVLVVLVLLVLSIVFIRYIGDTNNNIQSCAASGGVCAFQCGDIASGTEDYTIPDLTKSCADPTETCCLQIGR